MCTEMSLHPDEKNTIATSRLSVLEDEVHELNSLVGKLLKKLA